MQNNSKNTLDGMDNRRLNKEDATNNESTAAWANWNTLESETNINFPAEYCIEKAKNWVDNGSQL